MEKAIIIGAGPCGLSTALHLQKIGIDPLILDKGSIVQSIYNYPTYMIFHSTPELLEIGDVPFTTPNEKPTRVEALQYYRLVAERHALRIRCYETVVKVNHEGNGNFQLETENAFGEHFTHSTRTLIFATGFFDRPNRLGIKGEHLPKVFAYYKEAHPFAGMNVAVIGGNNSAVDAALDLQRTGAKVTVICRGETLSSKVKAWTRPLFESMEAKGRIKVLYHSRVKEISERSIWVESFNGNSQRIDNDFVFSLIGYRPDRTLLNSIGVKIDETDGRPVFNPETMETNVPGLYLAGVVASGSGEGNSIFIENGRFHGKSISSHLAARVNEES